MQAIHKMVGIWIQSVNPAASAKDERGLSQSTENAILLAGAVTIALLVVSVITAYVKDHLPG